LRQFSAYRLASDPQNRLSVFAPCRKCAGARDWALDATLHSQDQPSEGEASQAAFRASAALRALKFHQIRYVLAAAENRSFRRAADALNIEQSSVSRRVRELEAQLGASLFERTRSGVTLTEAGERFLAGATSAVVQLQAAAEVAGEMGRIEAGILRVGVLGPLGPGALKDLLRRTAAMAPTARIILAEAVGSGALDIAFLTKPPRSAGLQSEPLWSERLMALLPVHHGLASQTMVAWRDLADQRLVFADVGAGREMEAYARRRLARYHPAPHLCRQAISRETLMFLVAVGQGLSIIPGALEAAPAPGVICKPIRRETVRFSAVWSRNNEKPVLRRLLQIAKARQAQEDTRS
jgi:DNA-binding transcriptional LysR family regulator